MDRSRTIFERFREKDGYQHLRSLIGMPEDDYLEFKTLANSSFSDSGDKRPLAKAISAFANSAGGVVVLGVEAKQQNGKGPDVAQRIIGVTDVVELHSRLLSTLPHLTAGGNISLDYELLRELGEPSCLALHVPATETEPVMAMGQDQNKYFFRSGSVSLPMSHVQIGDMFARRVRAKLDLVWRVSRSEYNDFDLMFGVLNSGRVLAHYVAIHFFGTSSFIASTLQKIPNETNVEIIDCITDATAATHPPFYLHCGSSRFIVRSRQAWQRVESFPDEIAIRYELMCEGFSHMDELVITKEQLKASAYLLRYHPPGPV